MGRPIYTICVALFLFSYFSCAKATTYLIPSRINFPVKNLTGDLLENRIELFNRTFVVSPVRYDVHRVDKFSERGDVRNLEVRDLEVLNFVSLVNKHPGYAASTYTVKSDGYNLKIHRLQSTKGNVKFVDGNDTKQVLKKPVVYIQHGLFMSSDCFVLQGPDKDLAFILADAGFDVWIGNARGNTYSRSHESLSPSDSNFWEFTFEEIGKKDVSAFIEKIIEVTEVEKLDFIGYQLGATEGFIYLTDNTNRANNVIRLFVAIHPFAYWSDHDSEVLSAWSWDELSITPIDSEKKSNEENSIPYIRSEMERTAYSELYPQARFFGADLPYFCKEVGSAICLKVIESFYGSHESVNEHIYVDILKYFPAGVSKKMILHLLENMESGKFGSVKSWWGSVKEYDLSKVTVPVVIYDKESPNSFVKALNYDQLFQKLPNAVINLINEDFDILWPKEPPVIFQNHLVDLLKNYES